MSCLQAAGESPPPPSSPTLAWGLVALPEGVVTCTDGTDCSAADGGGCTAGASWAVCVPDVTHAGYPGYPNPGHGLGDGQSYCLEGYAPGTNGVPAEVCADPTAHSFFQVPQRLEPWACRPKPALLTCGPIACDSATMVPPSASAPHHCRRWTRPRPLSTVLVQGPQTISRRAAQMAHGRRARAHAHQPRVPLSWTASPMRRWS